MLHGAEAENPTETLPAPFAPVHAFARSPDKGIDALLNAYLFDADASGEASGTSKEELPIPCFFSFACPLLQSLEPQVAAAIDI